MSEKQFDFPVRNVCDIIIKDLQGNYYDINLLYCNGNDEIIIENERNKSIVTSYAFVLVLVYLILILIIHYKLFP